MVEETAELVVQVVDLAEAVDLVENTTSIVPIFFLEKAELVADTKVNMELAFTYI
jgi:hypothetical protein